MALALFVLATARDSVASFVNGLVIVYTILIIAYILSSMYFAFGGRLPYARWSSEVLGFLRDVCEPYLGFFRRFIPPLGPIDISPILAIFLLIILERVLTSVL